MATPSAEYLQSLSPEYLAQDIGGRLLNTSIAFIVVNTVVFGLFCVSRAVHNKRDTWDIWTFIPLTYICVLCLCIIGILVVKIGGGGRHIEYFIINDPTVIRTYLQLQTAVEFVYVVAITTPKLALLSLYLRIFINPIVRKITWVTIAAVILQWLSFGVIVWASICQPMRFKWNKTIPGHCADLLAAYRYFSVPNILIDLVILVLPIHTVYHLHASKLRKFGLAVTFTLGGLGIVAAIIRLRGYFGVPLLTDPTYYSTTAMMLSIIEPSAYFICTSLPYILPLGLNIYKRSRTGYESIRSLIKQRKSSSSGSGTGSGSGSGDEKAGSFDTVVVNDASKVEPYHP